MNWPEIIVALCVGFVVGRAATNAKWREKGDQGYPQMFSLGRMYWVCREDVPCVRCETKPR